MPPVRPWRGRDGHRGSRCCPATGSARRSSRRRAACSTRLGEFEFSEQLVGGASIDAHGTALTDDVAGRLPGRRRRAAGRRRRAEVGHDRSRGPAARAGAAGAAQGPGPLREPAPGAAQPGARSAPARCGRSDRGRHRSARRARADRRHLLRRQRARRRSRPRHLRVLGGRDRADRAGGLRGRAAPGGGRRDGARRDLGRQGQRARDLAAVAGDGRPGGGRLSARSSSSTCWSTTPRCSSSRTRPASTSS